MISLLSNSNMLLHHTQLSSILRCGKADRRVAVFVKRRRAIRAQYHEHGRDMLHSTYLATCTILSSSPPSSPPQPPTTTVHNVHQPPQTMPRLRSDLLRRSSVPRKRISKSPLLPLINHIPLTMFLAAHHLLRQRYYIRFYEELRV